MFSREKKFTHLASFQSIIDNEESNLNEDKLNKIAESFSYGTLNSFIWTEEYNALFQKLSYDIFDDFGSLTLSKSEADFLVIKSVCKMEHACLLYVILKLSLVCRKDKEVYSTIEECLDNYRMFFQAYSLGVDNVKAKLKENENATLIKENFESSKKTSFFNNLKKLLTFN